MEGPRVCVRAGLLSLRQVAADVPGGRLSVALGAIVRRAHSTLLRARRRTPPVLSAGVFRGGRRVACPEPVEGLGC
jgi:hypothetical protein